MSGINVDFVGKDSSQGQIAAYMKGQGRLDPGKMKPFIAEDKKGNLGVYTTCYLGGDPKNPASYRTIQVNDNTGVLRRDEWKQLDEAVVRIAEERLRGTQDLINRGMVYNLGNGMGTTVLETHDLSDALEAKLSMDAKTREKNDRQEYKHHYLPIPIIHVDFEINDRVLQVSRNMGNPLDTSMAERAARKVSEKLEEMLFTDTDYNWGGGSIKSLLNFADRIQYSISTSWTSLVNNTSQGSVGEQIVKDVLAMKQESLDNYHFGPWVLYIPSGYETLLDDDYNEYKTKTSRERILEISGIEGVVVVDKLPTDNVVLCHLSTDNIRIVRGMGIQTVQWSSEGGFVHNYKVLSIQVPQIRSDQNGRCGIVHGSV